MKANLLDRLHIFKESQYEQQEEKEIAPSHAQIFYKIDKYLEKINNKVGIAARPERVIFAVIYMLFSLPFTAVYIFTLILWTTVYQRFIILYKNL